jgi:hypothetical protein
MTAPALAPALAPSADGPALALDTESLRYPVGHWSVPDASPATLAGHLTEIAELPMRLREAIAGLDARQLDTPYREGGWTVRQVVHHLADSHVNAYVRCRLAATEDRPRIVAYDEAAWAELPDVRLAPGVSLALLDALHARWVTMLRALPPAALDERAYLHPEHGEVPLRTAVAMYAWHGRHHVAHVTGLRDRMGW